MDLVALLETLGAGMAVQVEPYRGRNAGGGSVFGPPVQVAPVWVEEKRRNLRASTGETTTVTATVWAALDADCPVGSRVTLPGGRTVTALTVARRDGGGLDVPEHLEIGCQ